MCPHVLSKPVLLSLVTLNQHKHAMESAIGLCFSTFPDQSICLPSGLYAARATKPRLSPSQYSYLSLPRVSANHPIAHIPTAITSMVDGSPHPTYNRVDKGRPANLAWASPFLRNIGSGRSIKHGGHAVKTDAPSPYITHYTELMEMARVLIESKQYNTAENILKDHELKILHDLEAAYQVKMEIMHILYLQGKYTEALEYAKQLYDNKALYAKRFKFELFYATKLMEIALDLKESQQYDLAVKLLKVQDPEVVNDPDASYYVKMEIMHILFLQEKYEEAWTYCEELYKNEHIYGPHFKYGLFYALKSGILRGLNQHDEEADACMKKFSENRSEAIPLAPPDKDESTKHHGS